jgi:hypothetical protein
LAVVERLVAAVARLTVGVLFVAASALAAGVVVRGVWSAIGVCSSCVDV